VGNVMSSTIWNDRIKGGVYLRVISRDILKPRGYFEVSLAAAVSCKRGNSAPTQCTRGIQLGEAGKPMPGRIRTRLRHSKWNHVDVNLKMILRRKKAAEFFAGNSF